MALEITYRPLFHLRIQHDAEMDLGPSEFDALSSNLQERRKEHYNIHDFLQITPTPDSHPLMVQHRMRLIQDPEGVTVYTEVREDPDAPGSYLQAFPLPANAKVRLRIDLINVSFPSSSNLPLNRLTERTLYLSNSFEHQEAGELHLTKEIPAFDPTATYELGDLVVDDDTTPTILLEARGSVTPAANPSAEDWLRLPTPVYTNGTEYDIGDQAMEGGVLYEATALGSHPAPPSANWKEVHTPKLRTGVSNADHVEVFYPVIDLPITEELTFAKIKLFDATDAEVKSTNLYHETKENLTAVHLDMDDLEPGFYRLEATDASDTNLSDFPRQFYLESTPLPTPAFGIVEIFNQNGNHALFNGDDQLISPSYNIRFRKRHSIWRYIFHGELKDLPPAELGDLEQEDPADSSRYVTTKALPLTTGSVQLANFGDTIDLPNPEPYSVILENEKIYSQMYIHL